MEGLIQDLRRGTVSKRRENRSARVAPAVFTTQTPKPQLSRVSYAVDCEVGGVIVTKP